jgi:hypothetical protein
MPQNIYRPGPAGTNRNSPLLEDLPQHRGRSTRRCALLCKAGETLWDTNAFSVPVDQPKACLIERQNLQWSLVGVLLAFLLSVSEALGKVFLKCSCSSGLALR